MNIEEWIELSTTTNELYRFYEKLIGLMVIPSNLQQTVEKHRRMCCNQYRITGDLA